MELPRTQTTDNPPKPRATSFFPLRKLKGNQPTPKMPAVHLAHLQEEDTGGNEDQDGDDPCRIEGSYGRVYGMLGKGCKGCPSG